MTDTVMAYLAGLFDGEGSVTLTFRNKKDKGGVSHKTYVLYAQLSNSDKSVLNILKGCFGGSVYEHKTIPKDKQVYFNFISYSWVVSNTQAYWALKGLLPFLYIKREEVEEAVAYIDRNLSKGRLARTYARWKKYDLYQSTKDEIAEDAENTRLRIKISRENKRQRIIYGTA